MAASSSNLDRMRIQRGPDEREYEIRRSTRGPDTWVRFATEGVDGRSAHETAIRFLLDWSEDHGGDFVVAWLPGRGHDPVELCSARGGVGRYLVDADEAAADATFGTALPPDELAHWRRMAAVRRSFDRYASDVA